MKKLTDKKIAYILLFTACLLTACASYYKIADPATGNIYYSEKVERQGSAVMFKDARSGAQVTIQNSEITEVNKEAYETGLKAPTSKPGQAPTAAPAENSAPK